jgi:hypothetical protein
MEELRIAMILNQITLLISNPRKTTPYYLIGMSAPGWGSQDVLEEPYCLADPKGSDYKENQVHSILKPRWNLARWLHRPDRMFYSL